MRSNIEPNSSFLYEAQSAALQPLPVSFPTLCFLMVFAYLHNLDLMTSALNVIFNLFAVSHQTVRCIDENALRDKLIPVEQVWEANKEILKHGGTSAFF